MPRARVLAEKKVLKGGKWGTGGGEKTPDLGQRIIAAAPFLQPKGHERTKKKRRRRFGGEARERNTQKTPPIDCVN